MNNKLPDINNVSAKVMIVEGCVHILYKIIVHDIRVAYTHAYIGVQRNRGILHGKHNRTNITDNKNMNNQSLSHCQHLIVISH